MNPIAHPTQLSELQNGTPEQIAAQRFTKKLVKAGFRKQALHVYHNAQQQPVYWRIRLKHPITGEKWLRPLSRDEQGRFVLKEPLFHRGKKPLYQLPRLLSQMDETVWIVEGEFCADALSKIGLLATTSGGMDSVLVTDWSLLAKRKVVIWPDNDEPGLKYGHSVTQQLQSLGCEIRWIDIAQLHLPAKGDCVDWLAANSQSSSQDILHLPQIHPPENQVALPKQTQQLNQTDQQLSVSKQPTRYSAYTNLFKVSAQGVFYLAEEESLWICSRLEVKALIRDGYSENWGRSCRC